MLIRSYAYSNIHICGCTHAIWCVLIDAMYVCLYASKHILFSFLRIVNFHVRSTKNEFLNMYMYRSYACISPWYFKPVKKNTLPKSSWCQIFLVLNWSKSSNTNSSSAARRSGFLLYSPKSHRTAWIHNVIEKETYPTQCFSLYVVHFLGDMLLKWIVRDRDHDRLPSWRRHWLDEDKLFLHGQSHGDGRGVFSLAITKK